jgi:hypothetical protein
MLVDVERLCADKGFLSYALPVLGEFARRNAHPYYGYGPETAGPGGSPDASEDRNQLAFHMSRAGTRVIFGGNQSGKSKAVAEEIKWWLCGDHPWQETPAAPQIYVFSASYLLLEAGVWAHLKTLLPEWKVLRYGPNVPHHSIPKWVEMVDGGKCWFVSGHGIKEARRKAQAARLNLIVIDEEVAGELYSELCVRLLAKGGRAIVSLTAYLSEDWVVALEERAMDGDPRVFMVRLNSLAAARAGHISKELLDEQAVGYTEEDYKVRILGETRRHEGLVYPEVRPDHWIDPVQIPADWTRYRAIDPGTRVFAVLWAAVAPNDRVYFYREMYFRGGSGSGPGYLKIANEIHAAEGWLWHAKSRTWQWGPKTERILISWMDPAPFMTAHSVENPQETLGTLFARAPYCLPCSPAPNDIQAGIQTVKLGLRYAPDGRPIYVFSKNLENLKSEFRKYRHQRDVDPSKPQRRVARFSGSNHLMDCLKYLSLGGLRYVSPNRMKLTREELRWGIPKTGDERRDAVMLDMFADEAAREREETTGVNVGGMGSCW